MVRQPRRDPTESESLRDEVRRIEGELAALRAEAATRAELAPLVAAVLGLQSADRDTLIGLGEMQERTARLELEALHRAFSVPPGTRSDHPKRDSEGAGRAIRREAVSTTAKLIVLGVAAFAAAAGYAVARAVGVAEVPAPPAVRATEVPGGH